MKALQRTEYIGLRLIRRFVLNERIAHRVSRWIPYYAPSENEADPMAIVESYVRALNSESVGLRGRRVLEIGAGRTNAVGYGITTVGAERVTLLEPYVPFDAARDQTLRASMPILTPTDSRRVRRVSGFQEIEASSVDVVLSNSVLEHVRELPSLLHDCRRVLAPGGVMLHRIDYRDHFFKYPYAFLTFSERTWSRWLDPGDLPRWRLPDHLAEFAAAGFVTKVVEQDSDPAAFAKIKRYLVGRFASGESGVEITSATLLSRIEN